MAVLPLRPLLISGTACGNCLKITLEEEASKGGRGSEAMGKSGWGRRRMRKKSSCSRMRGGRGQSQSAILHCKVSHEDPTGCFLFNQICKGFLGDFRFSLVLPPLIPSFSSSTLLSQYSFILFIASTPLLLHCLSL